MDSVRKMGTGMLFQDRFQIQDAFGGIFKGSCDGYRFPAFVFVEYGVEFGTDDGKRLGAEGETKRRLVGLDDLDHALGCPSGVSEDGVLKGLDQPIVGGLIGSDSFGARQ